jgi:predicted amidohydrolase
MHPKLPPLVPGLPQTAVALCQIATQQWDVAGNLERTAAALVEAGRQGAALAITPECALQGYGLEADAARTIARTRETAVALDGPELAQLAGVCAEHRLQAVIGTALRDSDGSLSNAAVIIGADGAIVDVYRKIHCRDFEDEQHTGPFRCGDRLVVHDHGPEGVQVGTCICFDREIPETIRSLRIAGAELIACPMACDTDRLLAPAQFATNEVVTQVRAAENEVFIAVVNHAQRFNGGSFIVGPGGEALVQLGSAPEVRTVELPTGWLRRDVRSRPLGWMGFGFRKPSCYRTC